MYAAYVNSPYSDPFSGGYLGLIRFKSNDCVKFRMFQRSSSTKGFPIFCNSITTCNLNQIIITRL